MKAYALVTPSGTVVCMVLAYNGVDAQKKAPVEYLDRVQAVRCIG